METNNKVISICKADIDHHIRFFGTGSFREGRKTPTPVELFTFNGAFGVVADNYLDQFPPESDHYEEIQKFKSGLNGE